MVQRILMRRCLSNAKTTASSSSGTTTTAVAAAVARSISSFSSSPSTIKSTTNNYYQTQTNARINARAADAILPSSRNLHKYPISHLSQQQRYKTFQTTPSLYNKEETFTEETKQQDEEKIPSFQNPIHHNDTDKEKVLFEDFSPDETPELVPLPPFDDGSDATVADPSLHALADEMLQLNMYEMKELVDRIADHFEIEEGDDDDLIPGGAASGAAVEEEEKEEKTAFDLKLTGFDAKSKIKVIKEIRAITGLGLKDAKEMVEGAPKTVKKEIKMEEAEELKAKIEAVGGTVEIE